MKTRATLPLLLGLGAAIVALIGCSAAPASQNVESVQSSRLPKVVATERPQEPTAAPKIIQADSVPPKAVAAVKDKPEAGSVEIGYRVGMHAPEFGMSLLDGTKVTSASLVEEGKPVFIYFHATW